MTQMFEQTCCIWNHAKNKFDLKVYNPFMNCADVGESSNVFTKYIFESELPFAHTSSFSWSVDRGHFEAAGVRNEHQL